MWMEEAYGKGKQKHKVLDKHKQEVNNREKNSKQGKMTVMVDQLQIKSLRGGEVGGNWSSWKHCLHADKQT